MRAVQKPKHLKSLLHLYLVEKLILFFKYFSISYATMKTCFLVIKRQNNNKNNYHISWLNYKTFLLATFHLIKVSIKAPKYLFEKWSIM